MWGAHVFAGQPTPVAPEAFKVVAALDLSLLVPLLVAGGLLLWRRLAWGYVVAAIGGIQGALYLIVLTLNSVIAITRGLVAAPGELPIWGTLAVLTTVATVLLLGNSSGARARLTSHWEVGPIGPERRERDRARARCAPDRAAPVPPGAFPSSAPKA